MISPLGIAASNAVVHNLRSIGPHGFGVSVSGMEVGAGKCREHVLSIFLHICRQSAPFQLA